MPEVLFLCTGNLCRSPSAAWFLAERIRKSGPDNMTVASAGTLGSVIGPPEALLKEGAAFGLDLAGHVPRRMEAGDIRRADLVIGMAREHVREAVLMDTESFGRSFTLREIVRRGHEVGPRSPDQTLDDWLMRLHGTRRHLDLIGTSGPDDIPDPMGGSSEGFRQMLTEVEALTSALHSLFWT